MCPCPNTLQHLHGPCTGRLSEKSGCGVSTGTVRFTDFDFADDAIIFAETTEVLPEDLQSQCRMDCESPGSRLRSRHSVHLDASIESIPVSYENVEITRTFAYCVSVYCSGVYPIFFLT